MNRRWALTSWTVTGGFLIFVVGLVVAFYAAPPPCMSSQLNLFAVGDTIDTKVLVLSSSYLPTTIWFPDLPPSIYGAYSVSLYPSTPANVLRLVTDFSPFANSVSSSL